MKGVILFTVCSKLARKWLQTSSQQLLVPTARPAFFHGNCACFVYDSLSTWPPCHVSQVQKGSASPFSRKTGNNKIAVIVVVVQRKKKCGGAGG